MYLFPCRFKDQSFYERKVYRLTEANRSIYEAMWIPISQCIDGTLCLVPDSLLDWYKKRQAEIN
jgi:hypothetical protein